jgi:hypothetical protein
MAVVAGRSTRSLGVMLGRIVSWWQRHGAWRREHVDTFAQVSVADADGITPFQHRVVEAVAFAIPTNAFESKVHADGTTYLVASLPERTSQLFVYDTEAAILGDGGDAHFEEWDYRTPDDLIRSVIAHVRKVHAT